jgi:hypothetical protein
VSLHLSVSEVQLRSAVGLRGDEDAALVEEKPQLIYTIQAIRLRASRASSSKAAWSVPSLDVQRCK